VLDHADAFIDFHSGAAAGACKRASITTPKRRAKFKRKSLALARAFGMPFVHENDLTGSASHYRI